MPSLVHTLRRQHHYSNEAQRKWALDGCTAEMARDARLMALARTQIAGHEYVSYWHLMKILFRQFYEPGSSILDAGCGEGSFWWTFPGHGYAVGLDLDTKRVTRAKRAAGGRIQFVVGDLASLPFKAETFHILFCRDVLEHVKDTEEALDEMSAVLQKNGVAIISMSNLLNPVMLLDTLLPKSASAAILSRLGIGPHCQRTFRFSPWKLTRELRKRRLRVRLWMLGAPVLGKWIYSWIMFDRMTQRGPLRRFKEMMVTVAQR